MRLCLVPIMSSDSRMDALRLSLFSQGSLYYGSKACIKDACTEQYLVGILLQLKI
jgi:hypothetical protein